MTQVYENCYDCIHGYTFWLFSFTTGLTFFVILACKRGFVHVWVQPIRENRGTIPSDVNQLDNRLTGDNTHLRCTITLRDVSIIRCVCMCVCGYVFVQCVCFGM